MRKFRFSPRMSPEFAPLLTGLPWLCYVIMFSRNHLKLLNTPNSPYGSVLILLDRIWFTARSAKNSEAMDSRGYVGRNLKALGKNKPHAKVKYTKNPYRNSYFDHNISYQT